ncbi:general stress protein [Bacillus sp. C11]|nr:general stress protein [Neobacillus terrae]
MEKRIVGVYNNGHEAVEAIEDLKRQGYDRDDISVVAKDHSDVEMINDETGTKTEEGMATGAATGGVLGGLAGFLAGVGALAIPGVGPILAAGPIAATLTGAAVGAGAGGLAGALIGMGIPEDEANRYENDVKSGKILVMVDENGKHSSLNLNNDTTDANLSGGMGAGTAGTTYGTDDTLRGTAIDDSRVNNGSGTRGGALRSGTVDANDDTLGGNRTVGGVGYDANSSLADNVSVDRTSSRDTLRNREDFSNESESMMTGGSTMGRTGEMPFGTGGTGVSDPSAVNSSGPDLDSSLDDNRNAGKTGAGMGDPTFGNEGGYNPVLGSDSMIGNTPPANSEADPGVNVNPWNETDNTARNRRRGTDSFKGE